MKTRLSRNFYLTEFTKSQTATRQGILNDPSEHDVLNIIALCRNVLQPVRDHFGKAVHISSGFRNVELNDKIGGVLGSQHTKGEAADIYINGITHYELTKWISENTTFDQVIMEFWNPKTDAGWVHVSYSKSSNRGKILQSMRNSQGKTIYKSGLPDA